MRTLTASRVRIGCKAEYQEVIVLQHTSKDSLAEVYCLTENHVRNLEKTLYQYELIESDHHRDVTSFRERAVEAEMAAVNMEDCFVTVFFLEYDDQSTCRSALCSLRSSSKGVVPNIFARPQQEPYNALSSVEP